MPSWIRRLPIVRTYAALRELRTRSEVLRDEVIKARAERDRARKVLTHALSYGRMKELVDEHSNAYRTADPFPHVVLDDVFEPELLRQILAEFDAMAMDRGKWRARDKDLERKWATEDIQHFGPITRSFIHQLNSGLFLNFLEGLTGIEGLISDPHIRGGGLHEILRGGALGVHADFNLHARLNVWRRLNLLLYLNENWDPAWGGELELWDRAGKQRVKSIAPIFNRVVVFDTSNYSYHGHPHPLMCPSDRSRKSIALYYYTVVKPEGEIDPHITLFLESGKVENVEEVEK
jgi:Rps23 Pro-64 3,4-dihydroxylase Tpa1-like proline 4-hydroxylase